VKVGLRLGVDFVEFAAANQTPFPLLLRGESLPETPDPKNAAAPLKGIWKEPGWIAPGSYGGCLMAYPVTILRVLTSSSSRARGAKTTPFFETLPSSSML